MHPSPPLRPHPRQPSPTTILVPTTVPVSIPTRPSPPHLTTHPNPPPALLAVLWGTDKARATMQTKMETSSGISNREKRKQVLTV